MEGFGVHYGHSHIDPSPRPHPDADPHPTPTHIPTPFPTLQLTPLLQASSFDHLIPVEPRPSQTIPYLLPVLHLAKVFILPYIIYSEQCKEIRFSFSSQTGPFIKSDAFDLFVFIQRGELRQLISRLYIGDLPVCHPHKTLAVNVKS